MGLKCGIIGIANSGKTTLFNCISGKKAETTDFAFSSKHSNIGMVHVPDERLYKIAEIIKPQKTTPATVEIVDIPGLTKGAGKGEGVGNRFLSDIGQTDALLHVVRCFDHPGLPHIEGSVDPVRDVETVNLELQVKDLETVEKKIDKYRKTAKAGDKEAARAVEILDLYKKHLESLRPVSEIPDDPEHKKYIDDLFLLTGKPVLYVCNVDEKSLSGENQYVRQVSEYLKDQDAEPLVIAAALEAEITELDSGEDRKAFLEDAGLSEPGVNKLVRSAYSLLNLISFFTAAGEKELRAWTLKKGMTASQAAGVIHSDMERGFIRAEVIHYPDFIQYGSEPACREAGKLSVEGKNYVVRDGDILHVRFNI